MTENRWPSDAPSPHERAYIGYWIGSDDSLIRIRFADRFGAEPEHIVEAYGMKWAGPVPQEEAERR